MQIDNRKFYNNNKYYLISTTHKKSPQKQLVNDKIMLYFGKTDWNVVIVIIMYNNKQIFYNIIEKNLTLNEIIL